MPKIRMWTIPIGVNITPKMRKWLQDKAKQDSEQTSIQDIIRRLILDAMIQEVQK